MVEQGLGLGSYSPFLYNKTMPATRTNQEWTQHLSRQDSQAIDDLRQLLLGAALYTLAAHLEDLQNRSEYDRIALAEDCAQDALLAVLAHLNDFRGESKFTTWAYKFGINIALTRARHERWKQVSLDELSEDGDGLDWLQLNDSAQIIDPELPMLQSEVGLLIQAVIRERLTARQRQVLKWIAFDDIPMDVVVERLHSNRNAIYKMLHDARLKVKQHLAAHGYELEEVAGLFG